MCFFFFKLICVKIKLGRVATKASADNFCKQYGPSSGPTFCRDPNCLTL